jgi:hypothetical protein
MITATLAPKGRTMLAQANSLGKPRNNRKPCRGGLRRISAEFRLGRPFRDSVICWIVTQAIGLG